jgi:hypothetical protein
LEVGLSLPYSIFKMRIDGSLHLVEAMPTLDDAKARAQELAELWPGKFSVAEAIEMKRISHLKGRRTGK